MRSTILFSLVLLAPAVARATGLVLPPPPTPTDAPAPRPELAALVKLAIDARIGPTSAEVTERRTYAVKAAYVNDVRAAFYASATGTSPPSVTVGGRAVGGSTLAPADADALRRRLVLDLHDPAPLRELGTPLFAAEPVDIPANGAVEVVTTTTVALSDHGTLRGLALPIDWAGSVVSRVDLDVRATSEAPLRVLYSPFHELAVVRDGVREAHAHYAGQSVCPDFDVTLLVSSGDGPVRLDLVPFRYGDQEGGYLLGLVTPDPTPVSGDVLPRDIAFVIDTSGSMSGVKMTQAKEALRGVLAGLRPADSFTIVSFSDQVRSFQPSVVLADAKNVASGLAFVDGLQATGGTNIYDALDTGLRALPRTTGHPRYVVFLTDGQPTAGTTSVDAIVGLPGMRDEGGARVFSFGIGDDVNTVLLDRLARQTSGDVLYVRPTQSVTAAVQDFFARISDPVLANPTLDLAAFGGADVYPKVLPDFFAGRTVTLLGRYSRAGQASVRLAGTRAGQPWSATFDVTLPEHALAEGYVPRIWAARHVGKLLADIKQGSADPGLVEQTLAVARRFGVTTNYTTFVADANGDVSLAYRGVSTAVTGTMAVDTSAALNGYGQSEAVRASAAPNVLVRYVSDRSLPVQGGYLTDTKLAGGETSFDLTFGSDRYFAFAAAERSWGAAALAAAGSNARFELLGRTFRITDPAAPPASAGGLPPESPTLPPPLWDPGAASSTAVTPSANAGETPADSGPGPTTSDPPPAPGLDGGAADAGKGLAGREGGCACQAAGDGVGLVPAALALAALLSRARSRRSGSRARGPRG